MPPYVISVHSILASTFGSYYEKPDLEKLEIYCGCRAHPIRMVLVRTIGDWKAIYQCTVCNKKKECSWRVLTQQLKIEDRE